jgi:hypothetical protein
MEGVEKGRGTRLGVNLRGGEECLVMEVDAPAIIIGKKMITFSHFSLDSFLLSQVTNLSNTNSFPSKNEPTPCTPYLPEQHRLHQVISTSGETYRKWVAHRRLGLKRDASEDFLLGEGSQHAQGSLDPIIVLPHNCLMGPVVTGLTSSRPGFRDPRTGIISSNGHMVLAMSALFLLLLLFFSFCFYFLFFFIFFTQIKINSLGEDSGPGQAMSAVFHLKDFSYWTVVPTLFGVCMYAKHTRHIFRRI